MHGVYAQKAPVITLHDSHFCKMWSHIQINIIGKNSSFSLKYKIIKLWLQVISDFLYGPYNVSETFMFWIFR